MPNPDPATVKAVIDCLRAEARRRLDLATTASGSMKNQAEYFRADGFNLAADAIERGEPFREMI